MAVWTIERMNAAEDLDAVLEVEQASFVSPWTREMFLWELHNSDVSHFYVLRLESERVAAYCSFWLVFDELHINNLAVRPAYRRQGLGEALLVHVLREAAQQGARRATLEVRRSNDVARRLYEKLAFVVTDTRCGYYTNPREDALILWRDKLDQTASGAA